MVIGCVMVQPTIKLAVKLGSNRLCRLAIDAVVTMRSFLWQGLDCCVQ